MIMLTILNIMGFHIFCTSSLEEVQKAVDSIKWRKVEGSDGVVVEMVEAAVDFGIEKITDLANRIYSTGQVP